MFIQLEIHIYLRNLKEEEEKEEKKTKESGKKATTKLLQAQNVSNDGWRSIKPHKYICAFLFFLFDIYFSYYLFLNRKSKNNKPQYFCLILIYFSLFSFSL